MIEVPTPEEAREQGTTVFQLVIIDLIDHVNRMEKRIEELERPE